MNMPIKYIEDIVGCGLFQHIRKSDYIDAYEQLNIKLRSYNKGEVICYQGDLIDAVCIVESGSVRGEKTYPNGEIHIVSIFDSGSIFALETAVSKKKTSPIDLIANESCRILFISLYSIDTSRYREGLRNALVEMLADENIRMIHKIEILAERGLRDRVLVYLNVLALKSGSDTVSVKMSREQMAQYLCVNRSALSNELNKMKREGLIDFKRGEFRLLENARKKRIDVMLTPDPDGAD